MKRLESRIRTNFHRDKRIKEDLSRKYGFDYTHPYARDTVPAVIASARTLHANNQSCVSRNNVLQQHISVPHHDTTTTKDVHHLQAARSYNSRMLSNGYRKTPHLDSYSKVLGFDINEDPYLMANIGYTPTIVLNQCDEPECGNGWLCDLCEESRISKPQYIPIAPSSTSWDDYDGFTADCFNILEHPSFVPITTKGSVPSSTSYDFPFYHLYDVFQHPDFITSSKPSVVVEGEAAYDDCTSSTFPASRTYDRLVILTILTFLQMVYSISSMKRFLHHSSISCGGGVPRHLLTGFSRLVFDRGRQPIGSMA